MAIWINIVFEIHNGIFDLVWNLSQKKDPRTLTFNYGMVRWLGKKTTSTLIIFGSFARICKCVAFFIIKIQKRKHIKLLLEWNTYT